MSINNKQNVKCPKCGQLSDITVWSSITVKDSPDLKEDLLHGKINIFRCPNCSQAALMPSPMLYHDEDKKLMISFTPCADSIQENKLYDEIMKASNESGELKKLEGYNLRFVTDFNELLEKILIFDSELNDKPLEIIKLMIIMQDADKSAQRSCRFGKRDGSELEFMITDRTENQVYTTRVPLESYNVVWQQLRESGVKPYSFAWERVNGAYATKLLNGFNN